LGRQGVTARVNALGRTKTFVEAVDQVGFENRGRSVYQSNNPTKPVELNRPPHFGQWAYQIRNNLMRRGKSERLEAEMLRTALIDLHDVLRAYLLIKVPEIRNAWQQSAPEHSSSDWQVKR
jgi:hypothetical protein